MANHKCSNCNNPIQLHQKYCEQCGSELIWSSSDDSGVETGSMFKRLGLGIVYFFIISYYIGAISSGSFMSLFLSVLLILPIWFFADKKNKETNIKNMIYRISNFRKKYKIRTIISGMLFFVLFLLGLISAIHNSLQEKAAFAEKKAYDNAPSPIIEILSQSGNLGNATGYTLVYKTKDTTSVIIDSQNFSGNNKENSVNFSLDGTGKSSLSISILARNKYKSTEKNIIITRNKSAEEIRIDNNEKERIANEQVQGEIAILDGYIKEMKEGYSFYDVATISTTAYRLEALWGLIKTDLDSPNTKIVQKAKETKTKLISTQKLVFPKLRTERCSLTKNTMWEYNVDVKCYGGTIKFIGGTFASNSNIKDSYSAVSDMLDLLRFKKASFYWYEASDYTYYTIDSPSDGTLE